MKLIYSRDGYKMYDRLICGYSFRVFKTPQGHFSFGAPQGDTPEAKEMFDNLVYYNKSIYHGDNMKTVADKIKIFISDWKKEHGI